MSFFFGSNVKKAMPAKVFVPQNKPKSAPLPSVKENNDAPSSSNSADNVTTAEDLNKPESFTSKVASPEKIAATSIRPFAPKIAISKPSISNNLPISATNQESKKRTRSDSTSSNNNNNTIAVAAPRTTVHEIKENNEDEDEEIVMAEVGQGSSSNNKARKRRKVTTSVPIIEDNNHNDEPSGDIDNANSQKANDNAISTNNALSSRKKQPIASATSASSNAVSSSSNSKVLDNATTGTKVSTIGGSNTDKSTNKNNNRSTNNSNNNLSSTALNNPPTNILKPTSAITKGKGMTFKSKKLERPLFPTFAFGDIPSNRFTRHTVYVRLPAPGLNGIEGVRLSNIQDRAVVTAIQPITAETPTAMKYLEQIELYDVILAVNHLDARYSTFTQILTTLSRTQSAPVSAQDTYVLDDGTQVSGRDLLLSATYNPHTGNSNSNSNNNNNNASLDPLGAGLGLGSVGSGIWALLRSQASLNGVPGVMARGSLKNATIDSIARVVFARMPKGHSPAPGPSIAQYLEQQQQQNMLLSMATAANAAALETTAAAVTNPLMSAEHLL